MDEIVRFFSPKNRGTKTGAGRLGYARRISMIPPLTILGIVDADLRSGPPNYDRAEPSAQALKIE